jgi:hypothetical protein
MENGNFTDFDFRTKEQKIADNNAKIAELKAQLSELKAKRYGMENAWAANRARIGDGSAYAQLQNQRYSERLSRDSERREKAVLAADERKKKAQDLAAAKRELGAVDVELESRLSPINRKKMENQRAEVVESIREIEQELGLRPSYIPEMPGFDQGTSLSNFKEAFAQIQDSEWTDARKAEELAKYAAASEEEGYGDFIASVRKRPTVEDKARGKDAAKKKAADAIERLKKRGENDMELIAFKEGRLNKFSDDYGTYEKINGEWVRTGNR